MQQTDTNIAQLKQQQEQQFALLTQQQEQQFAQTQQQIVHLNQSISHLVQLVQKFPRGNSGANSVQASYPHAEFHEPSEAFNNYHGAFKPRTRYSFQVIDSDGKKQRRRLKPTEIQVVGKVDNLIDRKRLAKDENTTKKVKTVGKLVRNEDLTVEEAKKAVKQLESQSLAPALSTRSSQRVTRSMSSLQGGRSAAALSSRRS